MERGFPLLNSETQLLKFSFKPSCLLRFSYSNIYFSLLVGKQSRWGNWVFPDPCSHQRLGVQQGVRLIWKWEWGREDCAVHYWTTTAIRCAAALFLHSRWGNTCEQVQEKQHRKREKKDECIRRTSLSKPFTGLFLLRDF